MNFSKGSDFIKIGKVSSINPQNCTARVLFEDEQNLVSYDLPIIVPFTLADKAYYMPKINERVLCVFLDNKRSQGYILGSFYAKNRLPPFQDENVSYIKYEDGTTVKYDKSSKTLDIDCVGDVNLNAKGEMKINSTGTLIINSDTSIKVTAPKIDLN